MFGLWLGLRDLHPLILFFRGFRGLAHGLLLQSVLSLVQVALVYRIFGQEGDPITVTVTDDDGGMGVGTSSIQVNDVSDRTKHVWIVFPDHIQILNSYE